MTSRSPGRRRRISRQLGARLGRRAADVGEEIRRWVGADPDSIEATDGAARVTTLAREVVTELARINDLVVSLDGDVVADPRNSAALALTAVVVDVDGSASSSHVDLVVPSGQSDHDTIEQIVTWAMAQGDVLTPSEHEQVMT